MLSAAVVIGTLGVKESFKFNNSQNTVALLLRLSQTGEYATYRENHTVILP